MWKLACLLLDIFNKVAYGRNSTSKEIEVSLFGRSWDHINLSIHRRIYMIALPVERLLSMAVKENDRLSLTMNLVVLLNQNSRNVNLKLVYFYVLICILFFIFYCFFWILKFSLPFIIRSYCVLVFFVYFFAGTTGNRTSYWPRAISKWRWRVRCAIASSTYYLLPCLINF